MDQSGGDLNDQTIDALLGIKIETTEEGANFAGLREKYPREEFWPGQSNWRWTPYRLIKTFLRQLDLKESDVLYDLGSGYGRVPLYASLATPAMCKGIEIVPERVDEAATVGRKLGIKNVEFSQGSVTDQDYGDGTVFFLFNPFSEETFREVIDQLEKISLQKKIRIVSLGPSTARFQYEHWLKPVESESMDHPWGLTIFESA
jgi:SAM-dependent methyltransferase